MAGIVGIYFFGVPGFAVIKTIVVYIKNLVVKKIKGEITLTI